MTGRLRTAFFGSAEFALPALAELAAATELVAVYTRPPAPAGRGRRPRETPVAVNCRELALAPRTPDRLDGLADEILALRLDLAVVAAYGLRIPATLLGLTGRGFWNLHPSLLPRWRGAAPVARAILAGDRQTGVALMRVVAELDAGPVAAMATTAIDDTETTAVLEARLARTGAGLLLAHLPELGRLPLREQDPAGVTYAARLTREDERVDWRQNAARILRQIRALHPRAWGEFDGERIGLLAAEPAAGRGAPGETLDDRLTIACGEGAIRLLSARRAGRRALPAAEFLRGRPVPAGAFWPLPDA